jgi:catechol 2,3-dioxygenase-like lactoylglutathione lyase family enzyme
MKNINVSGIDHIVLTVKDIKKTIQFYETALGMEVEYFGEGRVSLKFGRQKINLHEYGKEFEPKANLPMPGSEDLCFLTDMQIEKAKSFIEKLGVKIIEGPIKRTGATGPLVSIYFRDPDNNLIELSNII